VKLSGDVRGGGDGSPTTQYPTGEANYEYHGKKLAVYCSYLDKASDKDEALILLESHELWWTPNNTINYRYGNLPLAHIFNEIIEHPVPVDTLALKTLKRPPMALDILIS
jgi:hypothetical protein